MASGYPSSKDNFDTSHQDGVFEVIHASVTNDLADAVNKIEATLGVNPQGASTDVAARIASSMSLTLAQVLANGNSAGAKITNLTDPASAQDAATKNYVDTLSALGQSLAQVLAVGHDANGVTITNLGSPTNQADAACKGYVDSISFNSQSGTTYTLAATDVGKCVNLTNAGAVTVTVPTSASVGGWPSTFGRPTIQLREAGGTVTVSGAGGVSINSRGGAVTLAGAFAWATLVNTSGDNWDLFGDIA